MDRRKFIKTSMCLGCGAALVPTAQNNFMAEYLAKFSDDKFIYKRKEDLPNTIRLEACSLCDLNCPACMIRNFENEIKKTYTFDYLKFKDFKNLIDDNPQIKNIELSNNGEIFLNPELDKIIEYAHKKNICLSAFNGVHLNNLSDEMAECLVVNQFRLLNISIDGATPETYKIYRVGGDFNNVIANVQKINKYKKLYNSEYPLLTWKFILFGHNEHEIDLAKQKAKKFGMKISFSKNANDKYSPVKNKKMIFQKTGLNYDIDYFPKDFTYCSLLFNEPQIDWNGNILGCCLTLPNKNFGVNVFKDGLMSALNSLPIVASKNFLTNPSYKFPKNTESPCKNCWYYNKIIKAYPDRISEYALGNPCNKQEETSYLHKYQHGF